MVLELSKLDLQLNAAKITPQERGEISVVVVAHDVSRLKELDRLKNRFVSNVSHELRTPVTTIKLYAELMRRSSPDEWEEYLQVIEQEADRQAQLVEDILQISRIDAGRIEINLQPTSLNELVTRAVVSHRALAQQRGLILEEELAEPSPVTLADPTQMMQVLNNIVVNALHYTLKGKVVVSSGSQKRDGRTWATVAVSDTGIGISPEDMEHIFERFYRGRTSRHLAVPGTGLGLAIVKEIVEMHGGHVTVESQVGVGTTFTVWLPLAREK